MIVTNDIKSVSTLKQCTYIVATVPMSKGQQIIHPNTVKFKNYELPSCRRHHCVKLICHEKIYYIELDNTKKTSSSSSHTNISLQRSSL